MGQSFQLSTPTLVQRREEDYQQQVIRLQSAHDQGWPLDSKNYSPAAPRKMKIPWEKVAFSSGVFF